MSSIFVDSIKQALQGVGAALNADPELAISAAGRDIHFALKSEGPNLIHVRVQQGSFTISEGASGDEAFALTAPEDAWREFFATQPRAPFQSYWGMMRCLGPENGVKIEGDFEAAAKNARVWRLVLDLIRDVLHNRTKPPLEAVFYDDDEADEDSIVGRYTWIDTLRFGRCKIFYDMAGTGPQAVLLLHTAGADARQLHSLLNNKVLQERCTMYAFDLPGHGRSFPGTKTLPEGYGLDEDSYIDVIRQFIRKLNLSRPIVSGASMGGHVCLAVAIRAAELGVSGVIPCEGCDHLPTSPPIYGMGADLGESILNPERVCGMISPTSPAMYHRLIWWIYSSQAAKVFPGDLQFYFESWDGRDRVHLIDTKRCPVYMLTGEYDYSCTPTLSRATAAKIPGAVFTEMKGLGHFPMTEDPKVFLPYFLKGLDFIKEAHTAENN
ncbi:hypothetical protein B7463_g8246, partial [Scytalidium lignicola]